MHTFRGCRLLRLLIVALPVAAMWIALAVAADATPSPAVRSTGNDAEWLGHAWVDGRKTQSDVDGLADRLRGTGVRDLFVHAGPFNYDGTLDPARRPRAAWFTGAIRAALPGVRVQAWLGAETIAASLRGVRLALGTNAPQRKFGVAFYVDFAATPQDRSDYLRDWA